MATKTMVPQEDRPDLTVNAEGAAGGAPRTLETILGSSAPNAPKLKEVTVEKVNLKDTLKDSIKDTKEPKEVKDQKDHKEPKDHKDQKDNKDQKDHKDPKDTKDQKDHKDPKEHKDQKDTKDHKDPKESKDHKDVKDHKESIKEVKDHGKEIAETHPPVIDPGGPVEGGAHDFLTHLINRVSGLEKTVAELTKK